MSSVDRPADLVWLSDREDPRDTLLQTVFNAAGLSTLVLEDTANLTAIAEAVENTLLGGFGGSSLPACSLTALTSPRGLIVGALPPGAASAPAGDCGVYRRLRGWLSSRLCGLRKRKQEGKAAGMNPAAKLKLPVLLLRDSLLPDGTAEFYAQVQWPLKRLVNLRGLEQDTQSLATHLRYFLGLCSPTHPEALARNESTLQINAEHFFQQEFDRICSFMVSTLKGPCAVAAWNGTNYLLRRGYPAVIGAGFPMVDGSPGHYWTVVYLPQQTTAIDWTTGFPEGPKLLSEQQLEADELFDPVVKADRARFFRQVLEWAPADESWWSPGDADAPLSDLQLFD